MSALIPAALRESIAANELGVAALTPEESGLCARLVARFARTADEGDLLADMLGLDEGVRLWGERRVAERIMRLADSIGGAT